MQKYILAIDHGTTSTRAVLFDKAANVVEIAQKETTISYPHPGWVEQDANEIWLACLAVMSEVILKSRISSGLILLFKMTSLITAKPANQISLASCSTHPGCG